MALIDRVKERTGSDLSDAELQAMIDGIAGEMDVRFFERAGAGDRLAARVAIVPDPVRAGQSKLKRRFRWNRMKS